MSSVLVLLNNEHVYHNGFLDHHYHLPPPKEVLQPSRASQSLVPREVQSIKSYIRLLRDRSVDVPPMGVDQPCGLWLHPLLHGHLVQRSAHVQRVLDGFDFLKPERLAARVIKPLGAIATALQGELGAVKHIQIRAGYDAHDPSAHDVQMLDRLATQLDQKHGECRAALEMAMQEKNMEIAELSIKESKSAITRERSQDIPDLIILIKR